MAESRAHFDSEFEESFAPCPHKGWPNYSVCGSTRRLARFFLDPPRQIGFRCDQGHTNEWITGGIWIPREIFFDGSEFAAMRPPNFDLPAKKTRRKTLNLNEAQQQLARQAPRCVICECEPFNDAGPIDVLRALAKLHPATLFERLRPFLEQIPDDRESQLNWMSAIPHDLQADVDKAKADSRIEGDHGIPRAILDGMYDSLDTTQIRIIRNTLILPVCRKCNRMKRSTPHDTDTLLLYYARARHNGNVELAKKTDNAWDDIRRLNELAHSYVRRRTSTSGA